MDSARRPILDMLDRYRPQDEAEAAEATSEANFRNMLARVERLFGPEDRDSV